MSDTKKTITSSTDLSQIRIRNFVKDPEQDPATESKEIIRTLRPLYVYALMGTNETPKGSDFFYSYNPSLEWKVIKGKKPEDLNYAKTQGIVAKIALKMSINGEVAKIEYPPHRKGIVRGPINFHLKDFTIPLDNIIFCY